MNYEFPHITHLDEVRAAIAGSPEFLVAERDFGFVVNYMVSTPDTFPPVFTAGGSAKMRDAATRNKAIRRECRGIVFDKNGYLISRPYHKFFNVNQTDETQLHKVDFTQPHVILEKLDGSMIRPIQLDDDTYRVATKMGFTDVSKQAEEWLIGRDNYDDFINLHLERGQTPIFEWCSRKQRIVIDYPEDRLVLTAIRNTNSGEYKSYGQMCAYADAYGIEVVRQYAGTAANMEALLAETHDLLGQEGWIIRFADGHMLKIKGMEYILNHKAKDEIVRENNVITLILDEKLDDFKGAFDDDLRRRLDAFETDFWNGINRQAFSWEVMNSLVRKKYGNDRKAFALADTSDAFDSAVKSAIFKAWDSANFDWRGAVVDTVRKNLGSQPKVDSVRKLFGDAKWSYGANMGDDE